MSLYSKSFREGNFRGKEKSDERKEETWKKSDGIPFECGHGFDNDILVRILVKKKPGIFVYQAMRMQRTDFPILTCALSQVEGAYRAVIGARPARAMVIRDKQGLLKGGITEDSARAFAAYAAESAPTDSNVRGSAAYRTHLINVLARRSALELGGMNTWN